jgi:hypothetical protein
MVARISKSGKLPGRLKFKVRSNGTALLSGVPAHSAKGRTFRIVLKASNGIGTAARQVLVIHVKQSQVESCTAAAGSDLSGHGHDQVLRRTRTGSAVTGSEASGHWHQASMPTV